MEAFKKNLELENSLIKLTKQSINDIDSIGRIEIQNEEIQILRTQYLLFLKFSLSFFVRRAIFITKAISLDEGFDKDEKGILRNILRGLIEIVAKIYYAKNERKKFAQNYLWEQLKACLLSLFLSIKNGEQITKIPEGTNFFYKELKKIYSELPDLKDLVKIYSEYQLSILNPNAEGKKYLEIERKLNFPQTKELIREYWVDQEPLRKRDAYMWYKILSNQIHAVVFFEGYEARTIDLQLLGFLLILHWEFLSSIKEELSKNSQAEIDKFIQEIKKESNNFISEWRIKKKLI